MTLDNVTVNDAVAGVVDCLIGSMAPGDVDTTTCLGMYALTQADIDAGVVFNQAFVTGDDPNADPVGDDDRNAEDVPQVPGIEIAKDPDTQTVTLGTDAQFTITVTNTGNVTLTNVTVSDPNAATCDADLGTMSPGDAKQRLCAVTVTDDLVNVATATGTPPAGEPVDDEDDAAVNAIPQISTAKSAVGSIDEPGGVVLFTVTISNDSGASDPVTLISIVDDVYGDLTSPANPAISNSTCALVTIQPRGFYTCTFEGEFIGNAGELEKDTVRAEGVDDEQTPTSDEDDHTIALNDVPSSVEVTKTANPTSVPETGGNVTFTVTIKNTSVADVVMIDTVVDDLYGDVSAGCDKPLPTSLSIGETLTCRFTELVSGAAASDHRNVATAKGTDDDGQQVEGSDGAVVDLTPVIDLELNVVSQPTLGDVGQQATYTIILTNQGPSGATGVVVTNTLPPGVTYLSDTSGGAFDPATGLWTVGNLPAGSTVQFSIVVVLTTEGLHVDTAEVTAANEQDRDSVPADGSGDDWDRDTIQAVLVLPVTLPETLPVTGGPHTDRLVLTGLVLVLLGGALVLAARSSYPALAAGGGAGSWGRAPAARRQRSDRGEHEGN